MWPEPYANSASVLAVFIGEAVVIRADLMAAGDHVGLKDFTYAAAPEAWGHDIDVPKMMLYATTRVSSGYPDIVLASDHAARMSTPGAVRSG